MALAATTGKSSELPLSTEPERLAARRQARHATAPDGRRAQKEADPNHIRARRPRKPDLSESKCA